GEVPDDRRVDDEPEPEGDEERPGEDERNLRARELTAGEPRERNAQDDADGKGEQERHALAGLYQVALKGTAVDESRLKELLARVKAGGTGIDEALGELRQLPFADLGFAMVDHHRAIRQGAPEVILGERKTAEQIIAIAKELVRTKQNVLV